MVGNARCVVTVTDASCAFTGDAVRAAQMLGEAFSFNAVAPEDIDNMVDFWAAPGADEDADVERWLQECINGEKHLADPDAIFAAFLETARKHTSAVFGYAGTYYVLDSHRNELGTGHKSQDETGRAVVIRIAGLENLMRYLRHVSVRVKLTMVDS